MPLIRFNAPETTTYRVDNLKIRGGQTRRVNAELAALLARDPRIEIVEEKKE